MPANGQNKPGFFSNFGNALDSYNTPADKAAAADTAQNPYQSALIATASAEAEAKRQLNVAETAAAAYPDNSNYQAQVALNQQQLSATTQAYTNAQTNFNSANAPIAKLNSEGLDTGTNGTTKTIGETQSTPANPLNITNDDSGAAWAPSSPGVGAGTTKNSATSINSADNPGPTSNTQQIIAQSFGNSSIITQPNVLDQYASYTYAISWYLLTPDQFNAITVGGSALSFNTSKWNLLMQSGGAPVKGRDQYFPIDYYLDDLEIETFLMGKGTNMSTNDTSIKFKVVEPNGITLTQKLFQAVVAAYKNTKQDPNYVAAQYCLGVEFYGYDSNGKLVAPATGQYSQSGQFSSTNKQSVIQKYFPFIMQNITWRSANQAIEYHITGSPVPYVTATSQARGTIPFPFSLSGQTVKQILQGSPVAATNTSTTNSKPNKGERVPTAAPAQAKIPPMPTSYNTPGWDSLDKYVQQRAQQSWFDTYGRRYNADGTTNYGGG